MLTEEEYKTELYKIISKYPKKYRGAKYIRNWDRFWAEKKQIIDLCNLTNVKTALDIGTGIGMLPYQLMQKGITVEGTDIDEDTTGTMFIEACKLINLTRYELFVNPNKTLNLPKHYDLILSTRTEFDRQQGFDWNYFITDAFNYCNQLFIKTNIGGLINPFPDTIIPFSFKIAQWSFYIKKEDWQ